MKIASILIKIQYNKKSSYRK